MKEKHSSKWAVVMKHNAFKKKQYIVDKIESMKEKKEELGSNQGNRNLKNMIW